MTIEIPLTRGYVTRIDDADRVFTDGHKWFVALRQNTTYACANIDRKTVLMHSLLAPEWEIVDHADGDGLNNCRPNLRDGTGFRNRANSGVRSNNTSGYKGVTRHSPGKWTARIHVNRKQIYLGYFDSPEEAADAYDQAAVIYFGEYAKTNAMLGRATTPSQRRPPVERTHCLRGNHEYTPENTYVNPKGWRECRTCIRERHRVPSPQPRGSKPCLPGCTCGRHRPRR